MKRTSTRMAALLLALLLTLPLTLFQGVVAEPADGSEELTYLCPPQDFESYEADGTLNSADFSVLPPDYSVKEENGNVYFSMPDSADNDDKALILKNESNSGSTSKLVIEGSYRYSHKSAADGEGQFQCQLRDSSDGWYCLLRFKAFDGSVSVQTTGTSYQFLSYKMEPGKWYHVVAVFDSVQGTVDIYINDELVVSGLNFGTKDFVLRANQFIVCKAIKGNIPDSDPVSMDFDNGAMFYAPAVTVTVNGEEREMVYGDMADLSKDGYTLTQATVTCNGKTTVTVNPLVPVLGDTVIEAQYVASDIDYLNYMDFETVEPGTPDLSPWFTSTPTSGYEVKEEDGNKYVSMSLGTHDDAFIVRNPATSAENGKLVIEVSYRYTAQTGTATDAADQWICQLRPSWTNLLRMKSYNGDVYVASGGPDFRLPVGEWTHLTMVVDPATDTMDLYVNGAAQITGRALEEGRDITDLDVGQLIIAKAAHKNVPGNGATLDIDNIRFYYAPTYTVTVNGSAQQVTLGDTLPMPEGAEFAVVIDRDGARVVTGESIPVLRDLTVYTSDFVIYTQPGASLRTDTPTGLRFQTVLLQALVEAGNVADISIGTLFAPTAYVQQAGAFTKEALEAAGLADPYLDVQATVGQWYPGAAPVDGLYTFAGSVVGIPEAAYSQQLSAVGYVTVTLDDGQTLTVYSLYSEADHSRSVADVAAAALVDPDNGLSDAQLAQVQAIADAAGVSAAN